MSKECTFSNDAYSQTVFQLSATCVWTKIFNVKNILFNKWIALDSRPLQKISNKMIYNVWPLQKTLKYWHPHLPFGQHISVSTLALRQHLLYRKYFLLGVCVDLIYTDREHATTSWSLNWSGECMSWICPGMVERTRSRVLSPLVGEFVLAWLNEQDIGYYLLLLENLLFVPYDGRL